MSIYIKSLETLHCEPTDTRSWVIVNRVASGPHLSLLGASKSHMPCSGGECSKPIAISDQLDPHNPIILHCFHQSEIRLIERYPLCFCLDRLFCSFFSGLPSHESTLRVQEARLQSSQKSHTLYLDSATVELLRESRRAQRQPDAPSYRKMRACKSASDGAEAHCSFSRLLAFQW